MLYYANNSPHEKEPKSNIDVSRAMQTYAINPFAKTKALRGSQAV